MVGVRYKRVSDGNRSNAVVSFGVGDLVTGINTPFTGVITEISVKDGEIKYIIRSFAPIEVSGTRCTEFKAKPDKIRLLDSHSMKNEFLRHWNTVLKEVKREEDEAFKEMSLDEGKTISGILTTLSTKVSYSRFLPESYSFSYSAFDGTWRGFTQSNFKQCLMNLVVPALKKNQQLPDDSELDWRLVDALGGRGYYTLYCLANGIRAVTVDESDLQQPFDFSEYTRLSVNLPYISMDLEKKSFPFKPNDVLFMSYPDFPGTHVSYQVVSDYTNNGGQFVLVVYESQCQSNLSPETEEFLKDHYEPIESFRCIRDDDDWPERNQVKNECVVFKRTSQE